MCARAQQHLGEARMANRLSGIQSQRMSQAPPGGASAKARLSGAGLGSRGNSWEPLAAGLSASHVHVS